ncbi:MAG: U32 family peptidase, partial [Erysipelotrichaceae bacterium]|nr:U32 family peptidase [Erysipelotrichaceae bacterium]
MKPELLAPVGNQEHLQAAIAAGCDAVYFALQEFGARAFANNFSLEQAEQAIRQCHLMGVKVYIAMNTVLFEEEIEHAYQLAKTVTQMGADALIIQDIGLMSLIHHRLPDVVIHASTQVSVSQPSQIRQLKELGVRRVILARECDKETVEKCKEEGLEIEIFIHGALCISMSGRCLLSSVQFGRSGNRGTCAQPCRMQYDLYKNGKKVETQGHYLLSPKDVSIIDQVNTLPVDSLKIEGRMKSVEYVYESVRQTRKVLDGSPRSDQDKTNLMTAFYRGYTKGHYYDQRGKDLISQTSCNHLGVAIGRVKEVDQQQIRIALDKTLYQQDGIRFANKTGIRVNYLYDVHGKLQNHIPAGQTAVLKRMDGIKKGDVVYRTASYSLEKQIEQQILHSDRKVKVHAALSCSQIGQPLSCRLDDGEHCIQVQSQQTAQPAQSQALNPQTLEKQMNKTGNSWVEFSSIEANIAPGLFFPLGAINQLRRDAIDALAKERTQMPKLSERPWKPAVFGHETKGIFETLPHCADQDWNITNSYAVIAALEM